MREFPLTGPFTWRLGVAIIPGTDIALANRATMLLSFAVRDNVAYEAGHHQQGSGKAGRTRRGLFGAESSSADTLSTKWR